MTLIAFTPVDIKTRSESLSPLQAMRERALRVVLAGHCRGEGGGRSALHPYMDQ